jgi:hypothetical protein
MGLRSNVRFLVAQHNLGDEDISCLAQPGSRDFRPARFGVWRCARNSAQYSGRIVWRYGDSAFQRDRDNVACSDTHTCPKN